MKKLWKILPPLMADNFGFIETIRRTDGVGIIDDCGAYRLGRERRGGPDTRVCHTEIHSEDVVSGTRQKVLDALERAQERYQAKFALLSAGPCSAMIGTDLDEAAEQGAKAVGIPVKALNLTGHKTYDEGISETLCKMAELLCRDQKKIPGSVNLLGANSFDWPESMTVKIRSWFEGQGIRVIASSCEEMTAEQIAKMPAAERNVVLTVSGLKTAEYLHRVYATPWIAMAPLGESWSRRLMESIREEKPFACEGNIPKPCEEEESGQKILIIGEQLMANAVRETLIRECGMKGVRVATFYKLSKKLAFPGDIRIKDEEDAGRLLNDGRWEMILADPILRGLAPEQAKWVDFPHKVLSLYGESEPLPSLIGKGLNKWLEERGCV